MLGTATELEPVDCLICATTCEALAVFRCGHFVCYVCGLHIHAVDRAACPVCREKGETVVVTRTLPPAGDEEDQFGRESLQAMEAASVFNARLQCFIHGDSLAAEMRKMYEFLCPLPECWYKGMQEPFCEMYPLQEHMKVDHKLDYCSICLKFRSVFLCEQQVYSREDLQLHLDGVCPRDFPSFLGHPSCRFCRKTRFYDEDHLLDHMRHNHFTCDVCNRSEFIFTYYENRAKLLQHFQQSHHVCDHPACASVDPMMRVFACDLELAVHRQRAHNIRSRVALFDPDSAAAATSSGGSPSNNTAPATGSNANVIAITFDHVNRQETVKLMQTCGRSDNDGSGRKGGGGRQKNKRKGDKASGNYCTQSATPGLPPCFRAPGVLRPLMRERRAASVPSCVMMSSLHPRAFGVSESVEMYNMKNNVPVNQGELRRALDAALQAELRNPQRLQDFRECTAEFMSGRMLTMRYYNLLRTDFFPMERSFQEIFPLLVATVPQPERRDALVQIEKMQSSPEVQHAQRVQEEESMKAAVDEKWKKQFERLSIMEKKTGKHKGNVKGGGNNVWLEKGCAPLLSRASQQSEGTQQQGQQNQPQQFSWSGNNNCSRPSSCAQGTATATNNNNNNNNSRFSDPGRNPWGMTQQPRQPLMPTGTDYFHNPEDFPALPTTNVRRGFGVPHSRRAQRPNVWGRK